MQFGKALVGGIIGAAVGIGLLFVVIRFSDRFWLAIPFAIITGLGVRMAVSTAGHASYVRGALTAMLALAAYIGGLTVVTHVTSARANAPAAKPAVLNRAPEDGSDASGKDARATSDSRSRGKYTRVAPRFTSRPDGWLVPILDLELHLARDCGARGVRTWPWLGRWWARTLNSRLPNRRQPPRIQMPDVVGYGLKQSRHRRVQQRCREADEQRSHSQPRQIVPAIRAPSRRCRRAECRPTRSWRSR